MVIALAEGWVNILWWLLVLRMGELFIEMAQANIRGYFGVLLGVVGQYCKMTGGGI
ncbi:hypothetical protein OVS_00730 [Mycoplasma ovis str. Michigan]|uniref:Uncharacterized protein n=1 Tax=Mycoplasma ovis str. Michigan TaxID=1415773 RepID=A0ABM5P100_9MOLU|nr:hypothetical protein OVS_00730 [Mycoplasma ovis str. Michigan]